ncbi:rho GTPase-activating protein 24-like isoform X2 [Dysidea avara]|uniref:rho GTPase-activating protein 24-like isoform X2 n=1 Tax=Dysidea avara TaxID=196820 RepID=UPI00331F0E11
MEHSFSQSKLLSRNKVIKEGYLHKKGGRIPSWHKRWFILKGDILFYYRNPNETKPLGTVPLAGNKLTRLPDDPKLPNQYRFEITAGSGGQGITATHDSFLMYTEDPFETQAWVAAITRVMYEPFGGAMFGRPIVETVAIEKEFGGGGYVPFIVDRCCEYVKEKGLKEVGIFRLPGSTIRVNELKELFNEGHQIEFPTHVGEDVHTVASLLKLYLRELPEPVVDHYNYRKIIDATKAYDIDSVNGLTVLKETLELLPRPNYNLLKYISRFLYDVQQHSDVNKMISSNLGTVFGPNLLRPESDNPHELVACSNLLTRFVVIMIEANKDLFPKTNDEILPVKLRIPERRVSQETLSRKTSYSWTNSVYDESGLDKQATLRTVKKLTDERPVSVTEESLISFENDEHVEHTPAPTYPELAVSRKLDSPDIEAMRRQIHALNLEVSKHKKAARLWKKRYNQEKTARVQSEQRVEELRHALDETFKNFGIAYDNETDEVDGDVSDEISEL